MLSLSQQVIHLFFNITEQYMNFTVFISLILCNNLIAISSYEGNTVTPNSRASLVTALTSKAKKKIKSCDVWILSCITPIKMNENRDSKFQHAALKRTVSEPK